DGVNVLEVAAEEFVEEGVVLGREIWPIPPEPVASLRGVDLAKRSIVLGFGEPAGIDLLLEKLPRFAEEVPPAVLLFLTDPDVEVAPDPRAGVQIRDRLLRRMVPEVLLDGARVEERGIRLDARVKGAQETLAAIRERLPRVLAIQDQWEHAFS